MGVNVVKLANGEILVDMSPATATAATVLEGYTAFGADGNLIIGTASLCKSYATGRKITLTLPVSEWIANGDVYTLNVAETVSASDRGMAQIILSDELDTRLLELEADENLIRVEMLNGSVLVEIAELPEVDLTLEISILDELTASTNAALMCLDGKPFMFTLRADSWILSEDIYTQTVIVSDLTDGIIFGDVLLGDDDKVATEEMRQARNVSKIEVSNGSITATCYEHPPSVDLCYFIKIFNEE